LHLSVHLPRKVLLLRGQMTEVSMRRSIWLPLLSRQAVKTIQLILQNAVSVVEEGCGTEDRLAAPFAVARDCYADATIVPNDPAELSGDGDGNGGRRVPDGSAPNTEQPRSAPGQEPLSRQLNVPALPPRLLIQIPNLLCSAGILLAVVRASCPRQPGRDAAYGLASTSCCACRSSRISKSEYRSLFLSSACKSPTAVPRCRHHCARASPFGLRPASVRKQETTLITMSTAKETASAGLRIHCHQLAG